MITGMSEHVTPDSEQRRLTPFLLGTCTYSPGEKDTSGPQGDAFWNGVKDKKMEEAGVLVPRG